MDYFTKKPDIYRADPYIKGMEDGWYSLDEDGIVYYRTEQDAQIRSRGKKFVPYIRDSSGLCKQAGEGYYKVTNLSTMEVFVLNSEELKLRFKRCEGV